MVYGKIQTMKLSLDKPHKHIELLQRKQDEQGLTASENDTLLALQQARLDFLEEQFYFLQIEYQNHSLTYINLNNQQRSLSKLQDCTWDLLQIKL